MPTRSLTCPQCGAPQHVHPDTVVVLCEYCGSFVATDTSRVLRGDGLLNLQKKAVRSFVAPSRAEARRTVLQLEMERLRGAGERSAWAAVAREYYTLLPLTNPEMVPPDVRDGGGLVDWVRRARITGELLAFDEGVMEASSACNRLVQRLIDGDQPVAAARQLLEASRHLYRTLQAHPDYPDDGAGPDLERLAEQHVRAAVAGIEALLPRGVAARILVDVLGDDADGDATRCRQCGSSLDDVARAQGACPYCGCVIQIDEDPWLGGLLASWRATTAQIHDDEALAFAALGHPLTSFFVNGTVPAADDVMLFLRRAVGWLDGALLIGQLTLLRQAHGEHDELRQLFDTVEERLQHWRAGPRPEARGIHQAGSAAADPHPAPPDSADDDDSLDEDPWVLQTAAVWTTTREHIEDDQAEMTLLGQAMTPFFMGSTITVAQAMSLFEKAEPGYSLTRMQEALETQLVAGHQNPRLAEFLAALASELAKSN